MRKLLFTLLTVVYSTGYTQNLTDVSLFLKKDKIGTAIIFNKDDFDKQLDDGRQLLLISKPSSKLETQIMAVNGRESGYTAPCN